jgi:hypothetical protein
MRGLLILTAPLAILLIITSYHPIILEGMDSAGKSEGSGLNSLSFISIIGGIFVFVFYKMKFSRLAGPERISGWISPSPDRTFYYMAAVYHLVIRLCFINDHAIYDHHPFS